MFYNISYECSIKKCSMSQYFTGSQTKNASTCFLVKEWRNPLYNIKVMSRDKINLLRDKNVHLPGLSTCHTTSFPCLRHIHFSLRQGMTYLNIFIPQFCKKMFNKRRPLISVAVHGKFISGAEVLASVPSISAARKFHVKFLVLSDCVK